MNRAIAIVCTQGYFYYLTALIKSIVKNSDYRDDIVIFTDGFEPGYYKNTLRDIYKRLIFRKVDVEKYVKNNKCSAHFWSIEVFTLSEYDAVVYLGSDMLCLKNFNDLFEMPGDISMTREMRRPSTLNSGAMVVKKELMTPEIYNKLLATNYPPNHRPEIYGRDQKLFQLFFEDKVYVHDNKYNVLVTEMRPMDEIVFLHYFLKPNSPDFVLRCGNDLLKLWYDTNNAVVTW